MNEKITDKQIQDWKKKHGEIFKIEFEDGKSIYLKKPTRQVLKLAMTMLQTDPLRMVETIIKNCQLGGDNIEGNDSYLFGASTQIDKIIEIKQAELKKL
ncbi:MAG: hypothetical protein Q4G27_01270 [Flavobacteriaceae bacterium]|nr:hypothetical protein [Flavobacteriaceae bacterium]